MERPPGMVDILSPEALNESVPRGAGDGQGSAVRDRTAQQVTANTPTDASAAAPLASTRR